MRTAKRIMLMLSITALLCCLLSVAAFAAGSGDAAYFDYRKTGQFEWTAPAILFACLVFTLTAPMYIWQIVGI